MTDLLYAARSLFRSPSFTVTATLTLALGIGATTAVFSVVNAVLLEPLPYREPDRLVVSRMSLPDYRDFERDARSFEATAVWASNLYNLQSGDEVRQVLGGVVSRGLLPLLGVTPAAGRNFTPEDERLKTVILGHGLWQSLYGGEVSAIGQVLDLSGTPYTVIGVAPAGFHFPTSDFQLWTPIGVLETDARPQAQNRALRIFTALGRLRPGVTLGEARAEVASISGRLQRDHPVTNADITLQVQSLSERLLGDAETPLLVLLATVALLLLIACANVANLMLARTSAREREMAIRSALGAGRGRLFRQLAVESLVLALLGGAVGLLLAVWTVDSLPVLLRAHAPRAENIAIDARVILVALAATLATSLLFGTAPALQARADASALKDAGRGVLGSAAGRRLRRAVVTVQVALAVVVVIGAGLLVRSFVTLTTRDPGFVADGLLSFNVQMVKLQDGSARADAVATLLARLAQVPGVISAGGATGLAAVTAQRGSRFEVDGRPLAAAAARAYSIAATPDYFRALATPLLAGRPIAPSDTSGSMAVALINRVLAAQIFAGQDPVGRRLRLLNPELGDEWRTIVGVVGDIQYQGLDGAMQPAIYTPFAQTPQLWLYVMVRSGGDTTAVARSIRGIVRGVDPALTAADIRPMRDVLAGTVAAPRFSMGLVSLFALLALALAAVGIYGVVAHSVTERTHEIGLRMALGAGRATVLGMVMRDGLTLTAAGVAAGLAAAALVTGAMRQLLVGIGPRDPATFVAAGLTLALVALVATYLPARRATRVDPMVTLRAE